ncbi:MAG: hypothetical protein QM756_26710 [Polyangiaceae bacterium]
MTTGKSDPPAGSGNRNWGGTWPLFQEASSAYPNPRQAVTPFRPQTSDLDSLDARADLPETTPQAELEARRLTQSVPPPAPEWVRAARAMVDWLEQRLAAQQVSPIDEAKISRAWAAFSLGGVSDPQALRVAHLVSRAYHAIRETPRGSVELQAALLDCAGVLHRNLPSSIRQRTPLDVVTHVVRRLKTEADAWAAVVEGASELLGWKDYGRMHAALVLRILIEQKP